MTIRPKVMLNIVVFAFGTMAFYGVALFVLAFLTSQFNDSFQSVYKSALPLALVLEIPLVAHKIKGKYNETGYFSKLRFAMPFFENEVLLYLTTYVLTVITLFVLSLTVNDCFQNIWLSAIPLTVTSAMFLYSYKFWEYIKGQND